MDELRVSRKTFLGLCHQAKKMCLSSKMRACKAWVEPDQVQKHTTVENVARLRWSFTEDEETVNTMWEIDGFFVPLLMTSIRLHELSLRKRVS